MYFFIQETVNLNSRTLEKPLNVLITSNGILFILTDKLNFYGL